jgi:hypothetical protein
MRTDFCERCPDEDTDRCWICDGHGNDLMEQNLKEIIEKIEREIGGD